VDETLKPVVVALATLRRKVRQLKRVLVDKTLEVGLFKCLAQSRGSTPAKRALYDLWF
jgi:hypothetical protein